MFLLKVLLWLWLFYVFYLACMSLVRGHQAGTLTLASKLLGYPIIAAGLAIDVFMNAFVFTIIFLERPREWLVTDRLKRHIKQHTLRAKLARFLCNEILSPFDPSGDHCND